jgi:hypothetical protein
LTVNPTLDAAVGVGWDAWEAAARAAGVEAVTAWLAHRLGAPSAKGEALPLVQALLDARNGEERAEAASELAELVEGVDDLVADTLWEGVLAAGWEAEDPDIMFEATVRLAGIAEAHGELLAAAEYWIAFLNWRRQEGRVSDLEQVEAAFDEVVRLATLDGAVRDAAVYAYRQGEYTRLVEEEDDRAVEGDWEGDRSPYASWD